jgi:hypothetical protein
VEEVRRFPNALTEVRLVGNLDQVFVGQNVELLLASQEEVPHPSLTHAGGGDIAPDPKDPKGKKPLVKEFELRCTLDNPNGQYLPGQRAYLRLELDRKPLAWQWGRRFWQILQTKSSGSKWL